MVKRKSFNNLIGADAEQAARAFLEKQGLQLIDQNYAIERLGEIDLIMRDQQYYVFIEVKKRQSDCYGDAIEMVPKYKQNRIIRTASYFLMTRDLWHTALCRFDVIGILSSHTELIWIQDAFQLTR